MTHVYMFTFTNIISCAWYVQRYNTVIVDLIYFQLKRIIRHTNFPSTQLKTFKSNLCNDLFQFLWRKKTCCTDITVLFVGQHSRVFHQCSFITSFLLSWFCLYHIIQFICSFTIHTLFYVWTFTCTNKFPISFFLLNSSAQLL